MFFGPKYPGQPATAEPHLPSATSNIAVKEAWGEKGASENRGSRYRAFGERFDILGTAPGRRDPSFQQRTYDSGLGIYDYRNRSFDPSTGRFLQRDPQIGGDSLYNPYVFPGNNPVGNVDPMGLGEWQKIAEGLWKKEIAADEGDDPVTPPKKSVGVGPDQMQQFKGSNVVYAWNKGLKASFDTYIKSKHTALEKRRNAIKDKYRRNLDAAIAEVNRSLAEGGVLYKKHGLYSEKANMFIADIKAMAAQMKEKAKEDAEKGIGKHEKKVEDIEKKPNKANEIAKNIAKNPTSFWMDPWFWFDAVDKGKSGEEAGYWLEGQRQKAYDKAYKEFQTWKSTYKKQKEFSHPETIYNLLQEALRGVNSQWNNERLIEYHRLTCFYKEGMTQMALELQELYNSKEAKDVGYVATTLIFNRRSRKYENVSVSRKHRDFLQFDPKRVKWPSLPTHGIKANPMEVEFIK